jgi:hypothetical protein
MSGFAQRLEVPQEPEAVVRDEKLVVGAPAERAKKEVPNGFNAVPDLVLGGEPEKGDQFRDGVHRIGLLWSCLGRE